MRLVITRWVVGALAACGVGLAAAQTEPPAAPPQAPSAQPAEPGAHAEPKVQREQPARGLAKAGRIRSSHARPFQLDALPEDEVARRMAAPQKKGAPLKIGFARAVPGLDTEVGAGSAFDWQQLADGSIVGAVSVTSPSAASVRAGLRITKLPDDAVVRFQAPGHDEVFEIPAQAINDTIQRNLDAGDKGPDARTYWSPLVEGDTMLIEVELPAGGDPLGVRIAVPYVSHLVTSPAKGFTVPKLGGTTKSASCEVDAMCSGSSTAAMNSVALMDFFEVDGEYICTGTLLADQDASSNIPYFLSANHCINTQTVASTLSTYWFYRSSACNSGTPGPYQQLAGGATLLYNTTNTDTSFMRLNNTPPAGAVYSGWYASSLATAGTAVKGLHHPGGDLLKYSSGSVSSTYLNCSPPDATGAFSCSYATSPSSSTFYDILWSSGLTEPGSSGSGLFNGSGYLIGQLYGGSSTCGGGGDDIYGRFDVAYNASVKQWLSGQTLTVAKSGAGSGTVTSSPAAINCGTTCSASFATGTAVALSATPASGSSFTGWSGACTGTGACNVTMDAAKSVTANFVVGTPTLTVTKTGSGTVTSSPAGISCGTTCSYTFPYGSNVTLTATPGGGMIFTGWNGACSGTGACTVSVTGAVGVGASFTTQPKIASSTTVASSPNPSTTAQSVTVTATVTGAGSAPTGSVAFSVDGTPFTGCTAQAMLGGVSSCAMAGLTAGTHSITAQYSGDAQYNGSTSAALSQSVTTASTSGSTNVALAGNGGVASASSTNASFSLAAVNNGELTGANLTSNAWVDDTRDAFPDWVQIDFSGTQTIDHVVVYSVQDNYTSPVTPTDTMTFTTYGVTDFTVQGWNGSSWVTLGTVSGNNLVKRTVSFGPFTTSRIRVNVTNALLHYTRLVEIEAWATATVPSPLPPPPSGSGTNVALASNGGVASASSTNASFNLAAVNNGELTGANITANAWVDDTRDTFPDWVQIAFNGAQTIDHVVVYSIQDNYSSPTTPTDTMTFTTYGIVAFDVQAWNGSSWVTLGSVTGNNLVKRTVSFPATTTSQIRVVVNNALLHYARVVEIEAWTPSTTSGTGSTNYALSTSSAVASASSTNPSFNLAAVNNGELTGADITASAWVDDTRDVFPDWVQIDLNGAHAIDHVVVYSVQDNYASPTTPTDTMTFTTYGVTDFDVQGWNGSAWVTLGSVTGNNLVKRTVSFSAFTTSKIRVVVNNALLHYSRIVEVETWGS